MSVSLHRESREPLIKAASLHLKYATSRYMFAPVLTPVACSAVKDREAKDEIRASCEGTADADRKHRVRACATRFSCAGGRHQGERMWAAKHISGREVGRRLGRPAPRCVRYWLRGRMDKAPRGGIYFFADLYQKA